MLTIYRNHDRNKECKANLETPATRKRKSLSLPKNSRHTKGGS